MAKLTMCLGLPGSGKSFWAAQQGVVVVNKDDIRTTLKAKGWTWSRENEHSVEGTRDLMIIEALEKGLDVISSDTNFAPKHERRLRELAIKHGAEFDVKSFVDVPVELCVQRDKLREARVGEKVIKEMAATYLTPMQLLPTRRSPQLFLDLDGVFADFDKFAKEKFGFERDPHRVIPDDLFWNTLRGYKGRLFAELEPTPYCTQLWDALKGYNPIILTGCAYSIPFCSEDKREWVAKYVSPSVQVITTPSRFKCKYAVPGDILLDDSPKWESLWTGVGGVWVTHVAGKPDESIRELQSRLG